MAAEIGGSPQQIAYLQVTPVRCASDPEGPPRRLLVILQQLRI